MFLLLGWMISLEAEKYFWRSQESALVAAEAAFKEECAARQLSPARFHGPEVQNGPKGEFSFIWEGNERKESVVVAVSYLPYDVESWYWPALGASAK
jgi:hypothetical protein